MNSSERTSTPIYGLIESWFRDIDEYTDKPARFSSSYGNSCNTILDIQLEPVLGLGPSKYKVL